MKIRKESSFLISNKLLFLIASAHSSISSDRPLLVKAGAPLDPDFG